MNRRCSRDISSSCWICRCRLSAIWLKRGQPGEVVLAADLHPLVEQTRGQPLRGARGRAHRVDHQPGDQHPDPATNRVSAAPVIMHGAADPLQALLLLVQREGVVQLHPVAALPVGGHGGTHQQRRQRFPVGVPDERVPVGLGPVGHLAAAGRPAAR